MGGSTGGESKQRKAKNGVDDKYNSMGGNAIRRPRLKIRSNGES